MHTNSTPNYDLPQFLGTDQPDFVGDFNPAFLQIDTTMKANETAATGAESIANAANTKAGSAVKTANDAIAQIGAVETKADNAVTTANNAQETANTANTNANNAIAVANSAQTAANSALNSFQKFNLINTGSINFTYIKGTGTTPSNAMRFALDSTNTIGKVYGGITTTSTAGSDGNIEIKSTAPIFSPIESPIYIISVGISQRTTDKTITNINMRINTDGTVSLQWYQGTSSQTCFNNIIPFIIFEKNFGDTESASSLNMFQL